MRRAARLPEAPLTGEFVPAKGARFSKKEARAFGEELTAISKARGGILSPEMVVDAARKAPRSALHGYFEWRDPIAAESHRVDQARWLLRHIQYVVHIEGTPQPPVRAFYSIEPADGEEVEPGRSTAYASLQTVMGDERLMAQIVRSAMSMALSWEQRYGRYAELEEISAAIRSTAKRLSL